jgi:hypothetical protein
MSCLSRWLKGWGSITTRRNGRGAGSTRRADRGGGIEADQVDGGGSEASAEGRREEGASCAAVAGGDDDDAEMDRGGVTHGCLNAPVEFAVQAVAETEVR